MEFIDTRNKTQRTDPRPVTVATKMGSHLAAIAPDLDHKTMAMYGETPRLVFHGAAEAVEFFQGLEDEGFRFNQDIKIVPLEHCHGCGRLRISEEPDPAKAPELCPDCELRQKEEKRWNEEQKKAPKLSKNSTKG